MNLRPSLIVSASIIVGCLCLGLLMNQPSSGQPAPPPQIGRYQAFAGERSQNGVRVILCDTATGECYVHWPEANEGKGAWYTASPPWPTEAGRPRD